MRRLEHEVRLGLRLLTEGMVDERKAACIFGCVVMVWFGVRWKEDGAVDDIYSKGTDGEIAMMAC